MVCAIRLVISAAVIAFADGVVSGGGGGLGIDCAAAVAAATSWSTISCTCAAVKVKVVLSAVEFLMKSLTSIVQ